VLLEAGAAQLGHLIDRRRRQQVDVRPPGLEAHPRAALGEVEGVGDPDDAGLHRNRVTAPAVPDDRVQGLRGDDRPSGSS
jgi:hypothetical protein